MLGGTRKASVGVRRLDIAGASDKVKMEQRGPDTRITVPTGMLWLFVFGGIGMLTANAYLIREQLYEHNGRITTIERSLTHHLDQPAHGSSARMLLDLDRRIEEIEAARRERERRR